jgi:hypothetical protein
MAAPTDFVYNSARHGFATAALNWPTLAINAMLVSAQYVPSLSDQFVSAIPSFAILARDAVCTNIAVNAEGICSCLIPEFQSLLSPYIAAAVVLYVQSGLDSTSQLVYYSSTGNGFPFALQGFNYYVGFDSSSGGWFQV